VPIESTPTIYTVRDFLNWQKDGTLDLRPPFQRYAVWRSVTKSSFIDSMLRGYPIPALFIQDRTDPTSFHRKLVVIDGQQRLRTAIAFVDPNALGDADQRDHFTVSKLHDPERAGKPFLELSKDDRERILSTRFGVNIVGASVSNAELLEIFRRMNAYGARLNAQELRNARFAGLFKEVAYTLSTNTFDRWLGWGLFNRQEVAEMRDAEFASELLMLILGGTQSASRTAIDHAYEENEEAFPEMDESIDRFQTLISLVDRVFTKKDGVQRLISKMWTYSLVDALQRTTYGGPIVSARSRRARPPTLKNLRTACEQVHQAISQNRLPATVDRATRGAAGDKRSREARARFLERKLAAAAR
jgi:Protein of unknown function DUF262